MNHFYSLNLKNNSNQVELFVQNNLATSYSLALPNTAPANNSVPKWNATLAAFEWVDSGSFGAGTVSSVGLSAPTQFSISGSPVTTTGTLSLGWVNQSANVVLSSPSNGSSGTPLFRSLVNADLPTDISASKINGVLSKANIPGGTNATLFQLNGANGIILSNELGTGIKIFESGGAILGDLFCRNIFLSGNIDQSVTTTVNLGDSVLKLNSNFTTGTPTENAGLSVRRGAQNDAELLWIESVDQWQAGANNNLKAVSRRHEQSIVNSDLSAGSYPLTHNLGCEPHITLNDNTGVAVGISITHTNINTCVLNFAKIGSLIGTWKIVAIA